VLALGGPAVCVQLHRRLAGDLAAPAHRRQPASQHSLSTQGKDRNTRKDSHNENNLILNAEKIRNSVLK
jgi:hypothetical protein